MHVPLKRYILASETNQLEKKMLTPLEQMTMAEIFEHTQNRHEVIFESDLEGLEGSPKATAWDSFGEIEAVTFSDGSVYWH